MKNAKCICLLLALFIVFSCKTGQETENPEKEIRKTAVSIQGENFYINGKPTMQGILWNGINMEGLLPNSRMVQGVFDDMNPETIEKWAYPDTHTWDAERNTKEFIDAMDDWYNHGLLAFTINLQGGSPEGYSKFQPWENNSFETDGSLRPEYLNRMERIIDRADEIGMVVILGIFYFGQDERLKDDEAVKNAVDNTVDWLFKKGYTNVIIEIANECNNSNFDQNLIKAENIHDLIQLAKKEIDGRRFLVSASYNGNTLPTPNVVAISDFILIHGNGVHEPARIREMVDQVREMDGFKPMPIVFNEDDHFDFDKPDYNMKAAFEKHASWGYFDFRMEGESFKDGYQSVPVDWGINSQRKKAFFHKLKEITGGK
ncbi:cellulase family glycosylhydrolase [Bacteroidota bacterium]